MRCRFKGNVSKLIDDLKKLLSIIAYIELLDYPEYDDTIEMTNEIIKPRIEAFIKRWMKFYMMQIKED